MRGTMWLALAAASALGVAGAWAAAAAQEEDDGQELCASDPGSISSHAFLQQHVANPKLIGGVAGKGATEQHEDIMRAERDIAQVHREPELEIAKAKLGGGGRQRGGGQAALTDRGRHPTTTTKSVERPAAGPALTGQRRGALLALVLTCAGLATLATFGTWHALLRMVSSASEPQKRFMIQALELTYTTLALMNCMIILPESYDLTVKLGHGMPASGYLVGATGALQPVTTIALMPLVGSLSNLAKKRVTIGAIAGISLSALIYAEAAHPLIPTSAASRCVRLMVGRLMFGPCDGLALLLLLFAQSVTPGSEMVRFMIWKSVAITGGIGLGPITCSLANGVFGSVSVAERSAVPVMALFACWVAMIMLVSLVWPASATPLIAEEDLDHGRLPGTERCSGIESLPSGARSSIWWKTLCYGMERAFTVSALEAATVLILETEFGWRTSSAGYATGGALLATVPLSLLANGSLRAGWISDGLLLKASAGVAFVSSIFIFPAVGSVFHMNSAGGAALLLAADCLIFGTAYLAGGVMMGYGIRSSDDNTFRNEAHYTAAAQIMQNIGRVAGPVVARWCVSQGGRTLYAAIQCVVTAIALATCLQVDAKVRFPEA